MAYTKTNVANIMKENCNGIKMKAYVETEKFHLFCECVKIREEQSYNTLKEITDIVTKKCRKGPRAVTHAARIVSADICKALSDNHNSLFDMYLSLDEDNNVVIPALNIITIFATLSKRMNEN